MVVPFAYDLIHDNGPSGLFYASKGRGLQGAGAINRKNEVVVPFEYAVRNGECRDRIAFKNFTMSQFITVQAQPTDIFDTLGNLVAQYEDWDGGPDSKAAMIAVKKDGLWGFLDSTFRMIIPCQYPSATSLGDYGVVELDNGNNALVNSRGDTLAQGPFYYLYPAGMGLYRVSSGPNRYQMVIEGYVDSEGNHTFTPQQWHQLQEWWEARKQR